jgi:phosphoribosyl 1,2-cyclic phosphodiesterase
MKIRFWGVRGSLAKPGPATVRYGGNTSCVTVETAGGTLLVIDCGTGAHDLGQQLLRTRPQPLRGHILISHTHWDHIQGIPFFAPLFIAGNEWDFYAAQGFGESLRETLAGQMEYTYFPVTPEAFNASVRYHHLGEGSFRIGDALIHTRYLNHPALTLGFRIEADGASVVYACDHEPHQHEHAAHGDELVGEDREHAEFLRGADLVIHDAQYTAAEYPNKVGWGHSTFEYATRVCRAVGVKRLALTHHDPLRDDDSLDRLMRDLRARVAAEGGGIELFAAAEGREISLEGEALPTPARVEAPSALASGELRGTARVLLLGADARREAALREAVSADAVELWVEASPRLALAALPLQQPGLVLLDGALGDAALAFCDELRRHPDATLRETPCVVIGARPPGREHAIAAVTDWLAPPFSREYARTRIRAWLLRARCRWQPAPLPAEEAQRLVALQALRILDTPSEERFDRYTRLASALLGTPFAFISLVDAERQWFKSCLGIEGLTETPREVSFCAHAIHQRELFVVPDTLLDERFADNPAVADGPRVRFYVGRPLFLPDGHCVGTLCLADRRPRELSVQQAQLLHDLGALVEQELLRGERAAA